jgi:serine/threonine protein phosphatase PrpC
LGTAKTEHAPRRGANSQERGRAGTSRPMPSYELTVAASSAAAGRSRNEDSCVSRVRVGRGGSDTGVVAVADGMGGMGQGDKASQLVADHLEEAFARESTEDCGRLLLQAIEDTLAQMQEQASLDGRSMGTTCTAVAVDAEAIHLAHVGDCRGYLLRNGALHRLTSDHSAYEAHMRARSEGDDSPDPELRSILLRAIGPFPTAEADSRVMRWEFGDTVIICSDGVWQFVPEERILTSFAAEQIQAACQEIVQAAIDAGTNDNASVAAIQVRRRRRLHEQAGTRPPGELRSARAWCLGLVASVCILALVATAVLTNSRGSRPSAPPPAAAYGHTGIPAGSGEPALLVPPETNALLYPGDMDTQGAAPIPGDVGPAVEANQKDAPRSEPTTRSTRTKPKHRHQTGSRRDRELPTNPPEPTTLTPGQASLPEAGGERISDGASNPERTPQGAAQTTSSESTAGNTEPPDNPGTPSATVSPEHKGSDGRSPRGGEPHGR